VRHFLIADDWVLHWNDDTTLYYTVAEEQLNNTLKMLCWWNHSTGPSLVEVSWEGKRWDSKCDNGVRVIMILITQCKCKESQDTLGRKTTKSVCVKCYPTKMIVMLDWVETTNHCDKHNIHSVVFQLRGHNFITEKLRMLPEMTERGIHQRWITSSADHRTRIDRQTLCEQEAKLSLG